MIGMSITINGIIRTCFGVHFYKVIVSGKDKEKNEYQILD